MSGLVATAAEPHERGSVLGAYQGAASMGQVLGPFAASGVASASSLSIPFLSPGRRMHRRRCTPSVDHARGPNVTVSW